MDSWSTYVMITGTNPRLMAEDAGVARNREHLAALRGAAASQSAPKRRWTRWRRPLVTVRPAAA